MCWGVADPYPPSTWVTHGQCRRPRRSTARERGSSGGLRGDRREVLVIDMVEELDDRLEDVTAPRTVRPALRLCCS